MLKRTLLATVMAVFASGFLGAPALASHCPKDVKAIDAALKTSTISGAQMSKVKALRDKGNAEHSGGKHGDSIKSLHEAMAILGISH